MNPARRPMRFINNDAGMVVRVEAMMTAEMGRVAKALSSAMAAPTRPLKIICIDNPLMNSA